jgi:hypothetical protein
MGGMLQTTRRISSKLSSKPPSKMATSKLYAFAADSAARGGALYAFSADGEVYPCQNPKNTALCQALLDKSQTYSAEGRDVYRRAAYVDAAETVTVLGHALSGTDFADSTAVVDNITAYFGPRVGAFVLEWCKKNLPPPPPTTIYQIMHAPRRSPRLAEKGGSAASEPTVITPPKPSLKRSTATIARPLEPRYTPSCRADIRARQAILEEARVIRRNLGHARTSEDFAACSKDADSLWRRAMQELNGRGADEMFLSDVCHWLEWGKASVLGRVAHQWAINAIKSYIKCLEGRIDDPYDKEY